MAWRKGGGQISEPLSQRKLSIRNFLPKRRLTSVISPLSVNTPCSLIRRAGISGALLSSEYSGIRWTIASHHARATTLPLASSESP